MSRCLNCYVTVSTAHTKCPLCQRKLHVQDLSENEWYPVYTNISNDKPKRLFLKVFAFIAVIMVGVCFFINILTGTYRWWSLIVATGVLYAFFFIKHLLSPVNVVSKIVFQNYGLFLLLFLINIFTSKNYWSTNYVLPFLAITSTYIYWIVIRIKKLSPIEYSRSFILLMLYGFLPIILYAVGISIVIWPAIIAALNAFFSVVGLLIFAGKASLREIFRN